MAEVSRAIELLFNATDNTSSVVAGIGSGLDSLNQKVSAVAQPLANFTESLLKIEGAALAVGAGLVGFALKGAVDFESATVDLQKVLDSADGDVRQFAGAAIDISNKYGESSTQVLQSAADFKQAGFSAKEAFNLAEISIQALKITELQGGEAAADFIKILKGFDEPASSAARVLDVLNEVSNVFAVDSAQLANALARVGPIAHQTGFSVEEVTAAMTPAIEAFQDGDLVGTAFVTILQRLVGDNKNVTDALQQLGVAQFDANNHLRSGKDILHDVQVAYQTLDPSLKLVTASNLAGTDQAAKAILAFDSLGKTNQVLGVAMNASGSAAKELEVRMGAAKEQAERVLAIFDNVRILFGGTLLDSFKTLEGSAANLGLALQNMVKTGAFGGLSGLINEAELLLAQFIDSLTQNLPTAFAKLDFSGLSGQIDELKSAVSDLFGGVDLTTPEGLRAALQGIVNLGTDLAAFNTGLVKGFTEVKDALSFLTAGFGLTHTGGAELLGQLGAFTIAFTALSPVLTTVSASFTLVGGSLSLLSKAWQAYTVIQLAANAALAANPILFTVFAAAAVGVALSATNLGQSIVNLGSRLTSSAAGLLGFGSAAQAAAPPLNALGEAAKLTEQGFGLLVNPALQAKQAVTDLTGVTFTLRASFDDVTAGSSTAANAATGLQGAYRLTAEEISKLISAHEAFHFGLLNQAPIVENAATEIGSYFDKVREGGVASAGAALATDLATKGYKEQTIAVVDAETGVIRYTDALTLSGKAGEDAGQRTALAMSKTFEETLKAEKETNDFNLSWEKIQSQERTAVFTLAADIQLAQIQAGTEQIKAAFESVNTTITSTGDTISNLVKTFADLEGHAGSQSVIVDLLRDENERRQEALDLQKKLVEAQLDYLHAVVDRLGQGDAMITVTADGLETDLENFMMRILERIQIKASQEAQQFLLGLS